MATMDKENISKFGFFDGSIKLRAKSLESANFFEKFGYSNMYFPFENKTNAKGPTVEEEIDDNSTNAPESRTISLRSDCGNNKDSNSTENNESIQAKPEEKQNKKKLRLNNLFNNLLDTPIDNEFSERFRAIEQMDTIEIWEF